MTKYESLRIMFLESLKEVKELEDMSLNLSAEVDKLYNIIKEINKSLDKHYNGMIKDCKVYQTLLFRDLKEILKEVEI